MQKHWPPVDLDASEADIVSVKAGERHPGEPLKSDDSHFSELMKLMITSDE